MNAPEQFITEGLNPDIGIDEYHGGPGISKTGLDRIARSPYHYWALHINPDRPPEKERSGQLEGQLAHCAILEPGEFNKRYAVVPMDAPRRPTSTQINAKNPSADTLTAIAWWHKWEEAHQGVRCIAQGQYETAMRQAESVRSLPDIRAALDLGRSEVSAYWVDQETGVLCRCRPDFVHEANDTGVILLDVKTYSDASPDEFSRQIARKRYAVQDAYYSDGYAAASGRNVLAFVFIAVESEYPYTASAVMLTPESSDAGRRMYRRDLDTYTRCIRDGEWPAYGTGIHQVSLPDWALRNNEQE